jgi:hypothetical protein
MIENNPKKELSLEKNDTVIDKASLYDLAQAQIELEKKETPSNPEDASLTQEEQQKYAELLAQADPELAESVKNETKRNELKKLVLGLGLIGSQVAVGMNADAPKNFETLDTDQPNKEIAFETATDNTEDIANPFNVEPDNSLYENNNTDPEKEKKSSDKESQENNVEKFEIDLTASFELGNAVMSPEKQEEMQSQLVDFFDKLPQEIKDKINSGEAIINIESGSSPEVIVEKGIDSGRGIVHNNEELSIHRAEAGAEPTEAALRAVHLNADIEFKVPKGGVNPDNPVRYVKVSIGESLEYTPAGVGLEIPPLPENLAEFENVIYEIIDESPSMRAEANDVKQKIQQVVEEFGRDLEVKKLDAGESGGSEKHLKTLNSLLEEIESKNSEPFDEVKKIRIRTDEPDIDSSKALRKGEIGEQASQDYALEMQKTLDKLKSLNIQVELVAYEPGDTLNSITKILDADDLVRTEFDSQDQGWYANLNK